MTRHNFRKGDQVVVKGWPPSTAMEVTDTSDRALLILQTPSGAQLKVGRLQCTLAHRPANNREATK